MYSARICARNDFLLGKDYSANETVKRVTTYIFRYSIIIDIIFRHRFTLVETSVLLQKPQEDEPLYRSYQVKFRINTFYTYFRIVEHIYNLG